MTMDNSDPLSGSTCCDVTFVSWNVKSLNHPIKRKKVLSHLRNLNVGIAYLQETHLRTSDHFQLGGDGLANRIILIFIPSPEEQPSLLIRTFCLLCQRSKRTPRGDT